MKDFINLPLDYVTAIKVNIPLIATSQSSYQILIIGSIWLMSSTDLGGEKAWLFSKQIDCPVIV